MDQKKNTVIKEDIITIIGEIGENVNKFSGTTVLITGGAGFLGTQLILHLKDKGYEITV